MNAVHPTTTRAVLNVPASSTFLAMANLLRNNLNIETRRLPRLPCSAPLRRALNPHPIMIHLLVTMSNIQRYRFLYHLIKKLSCVESVLSLSDVRNSELNSGFMSRAHALRSLIRATFWFQGGLPRILGSFQSCLLALLSRCLPSYVFNSSMFHQSRNTNRRMVMNTLRGGNSNERRIYPIPVISFSPKISIMIL